MLLPGDDSAELQSSPSTDGTGRWQRIQHPNTTPSTVDFGTTGSGSAGAMLGVAV
ncbi:MAG: hypothetical protein J0M24_19600 [Verrucomicrobia bacterium]|nr:hypothetical protein [Verrucomicrobiota bacterium]